MKNLILIVTGIGLLWSCGRQAEITPQEGAAAQETEEVSLNSDAIKNGGITTGLAALEMISRTLSVNGLVDVPPQSLVSISFPLGGYLKHTELLPGRPVKRGEVIATMEDQSFVQLQQDYLQATSKLELLKLEYQRQMSLRQDEASSRKSYEVSKADYEMQQILVKSLSEKLQIVGISPNALTIDKISRTIPIRSPIDGFVKSVFVNVGKYVNPSDVLFEIVDPDHIHGSLTVFEKDQHLVKQGQKVSIMAAGHPEKKYRGEVILVSRNVDADRGVTIHCHFIGDHADLIPGMYVSAEIITDAQMMPVVPESAVVRHNGKHYVFLDEGGGKFRMAEVETGERQGGRVALTSNYIDWKEQSIALTGAYALLGKLKNVEEE